MPAGVTGQPAIDNYNSKQWDANNATTLSGLLNNANPGGGTTLVSGSNTYLNNQTQTLRDLLTIYTATQKDSVASNGSWDELKANIASAGDPDAIMTALFGDGLQGLQNNGLVNQNNLLLGGMGASAGIKLTKEFLATIMGRSAEDMAAWVEPLQNAMYEFGIDTPNIIANFLAHVKHESGTWNKEWGAKMKPLFDSHFGEDGNKFTR